MKFHLTLTLNGEYQPSFELLEVNNYLASKKVNELFINNNDVSIDEFNLTFADKEEQKILNEEKTEQIKLGEEKKLLEE